MQGLRIFLVIPERIKKEVAHYGKAPNVLTFEEFFLDYLDPAMKRWKRNGALVQPKASS